MDDSFDSELVTTVKDIRGVSNAEGRRVFAIRARIPGAAQWTTLSLMAIDNFGKVRINLLKPITGETTPAENQVLLEKKAFSTLNAPVDSMLEFP
jgi:hypothetical protein